MGNCAAPPLAIIYMNSIEVAIHQKLPSGILEWKRYIDDIFFVSTLSPHQILQVCNSISQCIQFTLELPIDNQISFLDCKLSLVNGCFEYSLFVKNTHSNTCLPFTSFVPNSRKKQLVHSETRRAINRSSNHSNRATSLQIITDRLHQNKYPSKFVRKHTYQLNVNEAQTPKEDPITFIKMPYNSERQKREILHLARRTGLKEKIRLIFLTEKPLSLSLRPKISRQSCPVNCLCCLTADHPQSCFKKNVVYQISCAVCGKIYIGQTKRCARSRIKEDMLNKSEHVYQHARSHNKESREVFTWKILAVVADLNTRLASEAFFIRQNSNNLINGCEGKDVLPFLSPN